MCLNKTSSMPVHHVRFLATRYANILQAYGPYYVEQDSGFFMSPSILERKFREGIEVCCTEQDGKKLWYLSTATVLALVDALLQIRDIVGNYCDTMEHIDNYNSDSPLYNAFKEARLSYPAEPCLLDPHVRPGTPFQNEFWEVSFSSKEELDFRVSHCQLWALGMIVALHCLALFKGACAKCIPMDLPPWPCGHMKLARAHWEHCLEWTREHSAHSPDPAFFPSSPTFLPSDTSKDSGCTEAVIQEEEDEDQIEVDHNDLNGFEEQTGRIFEPSPLFHFFFGQNGAIAVSA